MFELNFGKFSMARKPIINGGAIRPTDLLFHNFMIWALPLFTHVYMPASPDVVLICIHVFINITVFVYCIIYN